MKKLFHGAAYYPELWPEADIERDIAEMLSLGINVVRMGEFAWSKMEPDEGTISLDFFVKVMDRLHAAGIAVVFCTPTPTPPVWLTHGHPERCFVDADGHVMSHGARQHVSYEHPVVRAACLRIAEACALALGRHPALIGWQIDNEFKCHVAEDFSPAAIGSWRAWLEKRYGTIDRLNAAWGAEIWSQRYQRFDQVPAPVRTPFLHNTSLSTAYRLCSRERIAEFMDAQSALIRRHSVAPITHNFALGFSLNFERMSENLDFLSFDDYPSAAHWWRVVVDSDLFRAAKPGRPFWFMETSPAYNGWLGNHEPAHPPGFLVAEAVSTYALGSEAFCYWLWRQQRTGCELPHGSVMSAWMKPTIGYAQVQAVEAARQQLEPLLVASTPAAAEVALTWSDRGRVMLLTEPLGARNGHAVEFLPTIFGWHEALLRAGLHRDIRFEGASLDGLKLLITPAMPYASPEFLVRVEAFVRAGGIWIAAPLTGTRTGEHTVPTDGGLGAVETLAGVETVYSYPVTGTDAVGEAFGLSAPLSGWCSALRPVSPEAKVAGALKTALAADVAFLTERKLGRGAIVVLAAQPEGDAGKKLIEAIVTHYAQQAGVALKYTATPGTIVCPRAMNDGGTLWVTINMDGQGGEVTLPKGGVVDALTGESLPAGKFTLGKYVWRALKLS